LRLEVYVLFVYCICILTVNDIEASAEDELRMLAKRRSNEWSRLSANGCTSICGALFFKVADVICMRIVNDMASSCWRSVYSA